jgi:hypothetical protein
VDVNIYVSQNDRFIQSLLTTIHGDEDKKFDKISDSAAKQQPKQKVIDWLTFSFPVLQKRRVRGQAHFQ